MHEGESQMSTYRELVSFPLPWNHTGPELSDKTTSNVLCIIGLAVHVSKSDIQSSSLPCPCSTHLCLNCVSIEQTVKGVERCNE